MPCFLIGQDCTFVSKVLDQEGQPLSYVLVENLTNSTTAFSNEKGVFSINLQANKINQIHFHLLGYNTRLDSITCDELDNQAIILSQSILDEILITQTKLQKYKATASSKLDPQELSEVPTLFGDGDILKALTILPGIANTSEISSDITVRGAPSDQNLIFLNDIPVYQSSHLFGFSSAINTEGVRNLELYKNTIPAEYSGALSSVIKLNSKKGNHDHIRKKWGIGLMNTFFAVDGPINKKVRFACNARAFYFGLLTLPMQVQYSRKKREDLFGYNFYDFSADIEVDLRPKHTLNMTVYQVQDFLNTKNRYAGVDSEQKLSINWGTSSAVASVNSVFNSKLNHKFIVGHSSFRNVFDISLFKSKKLESASIKNSVFRTNHLKSMWIYDANFAVFKFGTHYKNSQIEPSSIKTNNKTTNNNYTFNQLISYISTNIPLNKRLNMYTGLSAVQYWQGESYHHALEPRLSLDYNFNDYILSLGYHYLRQFEFQSPTLNQALTNNIWYSIKGKLQAPQVHQFALSVNRDFSTQSKMNIDVFYRSYNNLLRFKNPSSTLLSFPSNWDDIIEHDGRAFAYGFETYFTHAFGRHQAKLAYSYLQYKEQFSAINKGKWYRGDYEIAHQIQLLYNYPMSKKWMFNAQFVFGSGQPVTLPIGKYNISQSEEILVYGSKNHTTLSPYHRLDISFTKSWKKKQSIRKLSFSVYNSYYHKNPIVYSYTDKAIDRDGNYTRIVPYLKEHNAVPIVPSVLYSVSF